MTTRLEALEAEMALRMVRLSELAAEQEAGSETAGAKAVALMAMVQMLETEVAVERARQVPDA